MPQKSIFQKGKEAAANALGIQTKDVIAANLMTETRRGMNKAFIPRFLFKPQFGLPRHIDVVNIKNLANTPYANMAIDAIIDQLCAVDWKIVPKDEQADPDEDDELKEHIEHVEEFYNNPNNNKGGFEKLRRKYLRDLLELDSGIIQKIFNQKGELTQMVARDGATFLKNPDQHGMLTNKADILFVRQLRAEETKPVNQIDPSRARDAATSVPGQETRGPQIFEMAREQAAYFQFGWQSASRPVPFGRKEIVWLEKNPRNDTQYGRSPIQVLENVLQTLVWSVRHEMEYYNDNNVPKGIIGVEGVDSDDLEQFRDQWQQEIMEKDQFGKWKKKFHKVPIVNQIPKFERVQFNAQELDLINQQKWFAKVVWACFGVTPAELGFTEDAKGQANQIVQSQIFKKRALNPILRMEEYHHNAEILSEFGYDDVEFQFDMFDVQEEKSRYELFEQQVQSGLKTVNEIRTQEGLETVPWGDKPPKDFMQSDSSINFGEFPRRRDDDNNEQGGNQEGDSLEEQERDRREDGMEQSLREKAVKSGAKTEDDMKASPTDPGTNPLILDEGEEQFSPEKLREKLENLIEQINKEAREDMLAIIESETGPDIISQIETATKDKEPDEKALRDVVDRIKKIFNTDSIKGAVSDVVKNSFMQGHDEAEKTLNRNFVPNNEAIDFLADQTFDRVKDMTSEIANDLKGELQRGIMNGESVDQIKNRVNKVFDVADGRTEAIARTEVNRAENHGNIQAWKNSEFSDKAMKFANVQHDHRTSALCKKIDKKYGTREKAIPLNETFEASAGSQTANDQSAPFHVNCRTKVEIFIPDEDVPE